MLPRPETNGKIASCAFKTHNFSPGFQVNIFVAERSILLLLNNFQKLGHYSNDPENRSDTKILTPLGNYEP